MIFKKKKLETIREIYFLQLNTIEIKIEEIELELVDFNSNSRFENILYRLDMLSIQIRLMQSGWYISEIDIKQKELKKRIKIIIYHINKLGTKKKIETLNKLNVLDMVNKQNYEIKEILEEIYCKLNLDNIGWELIDTTYCMRGEISNCNISQRQIYAHENCIHFTMIKDFEGAIHSLCEFVDNYQYKNQEPFNSYELICIRNMIKVITENIQ